MKQNLTIFTSIYYPNKIIQRPKFLKQSGPIGPLFIFRMKCMHAKAGAESMRFEGLQYEDKK